MSKTTSESSKNIPKAIPQKIVDQVRTESQKARGRFYVPFVYLLLDYVKSSDCGKKKVEYSNPMRMDASGSEMKVLDGKKTLKNVCKGAYNNNEECYERYCVRLFKPGIKETFLKYKTGEYSVSEMLKNNARYDLIETMKKYDITNIED